MHAIEAIVKPLIERTYERTYVRAALNPTAAADLLQFNNLPGYPNRPISGNGVRDWLAAMSDGAWVPEARGLVTFGDTPDGPVLLDGQHRLTSISMLPPKASISIGVQWSVPHNVRAVVDIGVKRRASDALHFEGIPNAKSQESIARKLMRDNTAILDAAHKAMKPVCSEIGSGAKRPIIGLCCVLMSRTDPAGEKVAAFTRALATGEGLAVDHPVKLLRDRLMRKGRKSGRTDSDAEQVELVMRAWKAWCKGERLTKLQLSVGPRPAAAAK